MAQLVKPVHHADRVFSGVVRHRVDHRYSSVAVNAVLVKECLLIVSYLLAFKIVNSAVKSVPLELLLHVAHYVLLDLVHDVEFAVEYPFRECGQVGPESSLIQLSLVQEL